jgi:RND superfamily putative drug exporter
MSSATSPSTVTLPSSAPSQQAAALLAREFPGLVSPSSSLIVLAGRNVTGSVGQASTLALGQAILSDPSLKALAGVSSLYSSYETYLAGETTLGLATLKSGLSGSPDPLRAINSTAALTWGVAETYTSTWSALVGNTTTDASQYNYPAYQLTERDYAGLPYALQNLTIFYQGLPGLGNGFNGTAACAADPGGVAACAQGVVEAVNAPFRSTPLGNSLFGQLGLQNFTAWPSVRGAASTLIGISAGMPGAWLSYVWEEFPSRSANATQIGAWTEGIVTGQRLWSYPLSVPAALRAQYLAPAGNVTLLQVSYTESDSSAAVASDINALAHLLPQTLNRTDPNRTLSTFQTGDSALVTRETELINQDTTTIIPITLLLLLGIVVVYFRSLLAPVIILGTIGIALALGLAGMVLLSRWLGPFTETSVTLLFTFVLGVGTDYSVFLTARYKEELVGGAPSSEAVVTAVSWAGESVVTSGLAVVLATLAMAFSGASLIANWGEVLSLGVAIAVLVAVTLVPSILSLVGPKVFWPYTGERFRRYADRRNERLRGKRTYFHRASLFATRRPYIVLGVVALLSLPLVYVALSAPQTYDYFDQIPASDPVLQGSAVVSHAFGPGYIFPLTVLVTVPSPLLPPGGPPDASELSTLNEVGSLLASHSGVSQVDSLFGPAGAPLSTWLAYDTLPPARQAALSSALSTFVGEDGRTVLYSVELAHNGQSTEAVSTLGAVRANVSAYLSGHPSIASVRYGGAPAVTEDLKDQLAQSNEFMVLAIVVGLLVFLFLALGSALLPPLALLTIGVTVAWAWAITALVALGIFGLGLFFYVPSVLFLLVMGLGMDYNIFLLTRVREERLSSGGSPESVVEAVTHTGGIITAAGVILAGAFFSLTLAQVILLRVLGFAVGLAVLLDAMVVRTYLVPAALKLTGEKAWWGPHALQRGGARPGARAPPDEDERPPSP